jgi:hypothetical protein
MHGVKRVIAFCCLTAVVPTLLIICPLYLKHEVFKDVIISVAESDILEIRDGISSIFCQEHRLKMNSSFNAFQLNHMPAVAKTRKHIRLKKSMQLPDDSLEFWGFYLMRGATVELKVCSRFEGSRILVVKGERNLKTCGLLEHNLKKFGAAFNAEKNQVKVTFETAAEIVEPEITAHEEENSHFVSPDLILTDDEAKFNHGGEDAYDYDMMDDDVDEKIKTHNDNAEESTSQRSAKLTTNNKNNDDLNNAPLPGNHVNTDDNNDDDDDEKKTSAKKHAKRHIKIVRDKKNTHYDPLNKKKQKHHHKHNVHNARARRDTVLDRGINHGGNAQNFIAKNESDSTSSFENSLLECYTGDILLTAGFSPSKNCNSVKYLEQGAHLVSTHEVSTDGYYYYIFYSDNDYDANHIHALFDIYKPTYLYSNISETKGCINSTKCEFKVDMFSNEVVIVEVPTRDGIEHEDDDITLLTSQCIPRTSVYIIFPVLVLFFILGCAFI